MRRIFATVAISLALAVAAGCATGRAVHSAEEAIKKGDYDSAVVYYRTALANDPQSVELRIALARATRMATDEHVRRARELEGQDQLAAALAEYKLAADLDSSSTFAATKSSELERRLQDLAEASRPQPRIAGLRQQAAQTSPIPQLDPRTIVPELHFSGIAVRDVLSTISALTKINIRYDPTLSDQALSRPYSIDIQNTPLEDVLNEVLTANTLTFKVVNAQSIFIYQDNAANRTKYEDQYTQTFYLSNAAPADTIQILNQIVPQTLTNRPAFVANVAQNSIVVRTTAPIMKVIEQIIKANDKPRPEVNIEAEILEVDRTFIRQLGLDLNQYALGLTFSPELAPPNSSGTFPPGTPPPFNANTLSRGVSPADFYITSPTALIHLLESNQTTKVLAKPHLEGRDGQAMTLLLGDTVPIPQTTFNAAAAGGVANIPTTSVTYQPVGVNLLFTPRVTYQDEIILDNLTLEKSGLGANTTVGGQDFPTIVTRRAQGSLRLRDGESNIIAGLLRDDDRKTLKSFPGFTNIPLLRSLFGNSDAEIDQTDVIMIITPHILRSHELTPDDLKPLYVGTGQNFGSGPQPTLISPDVPIPDSSAPAGPAPAASGPLAPAPQPAPTGAISAVPGSTGTPAGGATSAPRIPTVVPIEAAPSSSPAPPATPPAATRVTLTAPTPAAGTLAAGSGPFTVPITIANAPALSSITLTVTYNPAIIKNVMVTQGSFMQQGGVTPTFVPAVDGNAGRIDIAISRPPAAGGASSGGLLAAIAFTAGTAGGTDFSITGTATSASGQTVPLEFVPARIVVK